MSHGGNFLDGRTHMAQEWHVNLMGNVVGPMSPTELKRFAAQKKLPPETNVRLGSSGEWMLAAGVPGLLTARNAPPSERESIEQPARPLPRVAPQQFDNFTDAVCVLLQFVGVIFFCLSLVGLPVLFSSSGLTGFNVSLSVSMIISAMVSGLTLVAFAGGVRALLKIASKN